MSAGRLGIQTILIVSGIVIPRVLGAESFGRYAAVMAVIAILRSVSSLGLPLVAIRTFAPLWRSPQRSEAIALGSSIWTASLISSAAAGAIATVWFTLSPVLGLVPWLCVLFGLLALLRSADESAKNLLIAVNRVGTMTWLELLRAGMMLPVVVFAFLGFGLPGVFFAVGGLWLILMASGYLLLVRAVPLKLRLFSYASLRPHIYYSLSAYAGIVAQIIQVQFSIYVVAAWFAARQAGFLALSVQIYSLFQGMFIAARRSLAPILAELEAAGQLDRLRYWGGLMMRFSAAICCLLLVGWTLIGRDLLRWLFTEDFISVYPCTTLILLGLVFYCIGAACNILLLIRGHAGTASINSVIYAALTIAGILHVVHDGAAESALRICGVYAIASVAFFASCYFTLALRGRIWLPFRRTLLLILPAAIAWPITGWDVSLIQRFAASVLFIALYAGMAVGLKLLPAGEIREIVRTVRRTGTAS